MSQLLLTKISAVRAKHSAVAIAGGIALAVAALVAGLWIGMMLDWWLDLPRWVRAAFLAIDLALLVVIVVSYIVLPISRGPDEDEIALRVEEANPQFATRLIASIQLSRPESVPAGASRSMGSAMIMQTESIASSVDFAQVVRTDRLLKHLLLAAGILLTALSMFIYGLRDRRSTDVLVRV